MRRFPSKRLLVRRLRAFLRRLRGSLLLQVGMASGALIGGFALLIYLLEHKTEKTLIQSYGDSLWYTLVSMSTTGYGDIVPQSGWGKLAGSFSIVVGIVLAAVVSAVITAVLVERRLKEGRGMKSLKKKNHMVVCGWNAYGDKVLRSIVAVGGNRLPDVVLVNELEETDMQRVVSAHRELVIQQVRGDFASEYTLQRAAVDKAQTVVILSDSVAGSGAGDADQRSIIAAMAVKALAPKVKTTVQITREESAEHLKRANVDEIVIDGEFSGYLISNATLSPGVHQVVRELLTFDYGNFIGKTQIPRQFVGKTFNELAGWFLEKQSAILIGVMSEEKDITYNDFLSDDYSAIDAFIKRKFAESQNRQLTAQYNKLDVRLNPGPTYVIEDTDIAFVITSDLDRVA